MTDLHFSTEALERARHNKVGEPLINAQEAQMICDAALAHDAERLEREIIEQRVATLKCSHCKVNPAACVGRYENAKRETLACSECCGHGNEDGYCQPLSETALLRALTEQP